MKEVIAPLFPGSKVMGRVFVMDNIQWMKGPKPGKSIQCDGYTITAAPSNRRRKK